MGDYDSPNAGNGREMVRFAAAVAGTYSITVWPLGPPENRPGQFEIRLANVRRATPQELQEARRPEILKAKGIENWVRRLPGLPSTTPIVRSTPSSG